MRKSDQYDEWFLPFRAVRAHLAGAEAAKAAILFYEAIANFAAPVASSGVNRRPAPLRL